MALTMTPSGRSRRHLHEHRIVRVVALTLGALLLAHSAQAQFTLNLQIHQPVISFPDANPTTTPVIAATDPVLVRVVAKNGSGVPDSTTPWSVSAFAGGNLMSGADAIAISNVTWTAVQVGFCLGGCTCLAGTASDLVPQLMILGQGNTDLTLGCLYSFSLANDWSYNPGSYSQTMTVTASSP